MCLTNPIPTLAPIPPGQWCAGAWELPCAKTHPDAAPARPLPPWVDRRRYQHFLAELSKPWKAEAAA